MDLARDAPDPRTAAKRILDFSQELGGEDNATAIVVPLAGWGKIKGPDQTKELREYRRIQASAYILLYIYLRRLIVFYSWVRTT